MRTLKDRTIYGLTAMFIAVLGVVAAFYLLPNARRAIASPPELQIYTMDTQAVMEAHPAFLEAVEEYRARIEEMEERLAEVGDEERMFVQQMMQQQIQQIGAELQERAFDKMQEDIEDFAAEKGYAFIIDRNVMIVGGRDITEEALEAIGADAPEIDVPDVLDLP